MKNLILTISLIFIVNNGSAQNASQWRGPNRDGIYLENNLLKEWPGEGLKVLWQFDSLGLGFTSVAIQNETIYTTGITDSIGYLFAFNQKGDLKWKKPYGKEWMDNYRGTRSTPVIHDKHAYILSGLGVLYCLNALDGEIKWTVDFFKEYDGKQVRFGIAENLLIYDDKLICTPGGKNDNVLAINRLSGELIWKSKAKGELSAYGTPKLIEHNKVKYLIVTTAKSIMSLNPRNGKMIWSFDLKYPNGIHGNGPVYKSGHLFEMNGWEYGSVMLKISKTGKEVKQVWRSKYFDLEHGGVVLINNNIYGTDYTSKLFLCADWKTGMIKDSIKAFSPGSVIAAENLIYCITYKGELALIEPKPNGFELNSKFKLPLGSKKDHIAFPVISKGRLFIRYHNKLLVYSIKKE